MTITSICSVCGGKHRKSLQPLKAQSQICHNKKINVGLMTHAEVEKCIRFGSPLDKPVENLVAHAKVWVFADMYLADTLKEL